MTRRLTVIPKLFIIGCLLASLASFGLAARAQDGPKVHIVQDGETLAEIAALYNVSVEALLAANDIPDPDVILPGMELTIPDTVDEGKPLPTEAAPAADAPDTAEAMPAGDTAAPTAEPTPSAPVALDGGQIYVIQPRDTLDTIAQRLGVDVRTLIDANFGPDDNPNYLVAGQEIVIPGGSALDGLVDGQGGGGAAEDTTYAIQVADTLDEIAQLYNVALESILYANAMERPSIVPGQVIVIPGDAPPYGVVPPLSDRERLAGRAQPTDGQGGGGFTGETYTVQVADTLDTIAQRYDVALLSIIYANELSMPYVIRPGDELLIPDGAPAYGLTPPRPGEPVAAQPAMADGQGGGDGVADVIMDTDSEIYLVQDGDTIMSIVTGMGVDLMDFLRANPALLEEIELLPGTEVTIP